MFPMRTVHHAIIDADETTGLATCAVCGPRTPARRRKGYKGGIRWVCRNSDPRKCHKASHHKWLATRTRFETEQSGLCAICGESGKLVLDHCHSTGRFRAALCHACNSALGLFREDPARMRKAAEYVEEQAKLSATYVAEPAEPKRERPVCLVRECGRTSLSRGLCSRCYQRARRDADLVKHRVVAPGREADCKSAASELSEFDSQATH